MHLGCAELAESSTPELAICSADLTYALEPRTLQPCDASYTHPASLAPMLHHLKAVAISILFPLLLALLYPRVLHHLKVVAISILFPLLLALLYPFSRVPIGMVGQGHAEPLRDNDDLRTKTMTRR